MHAEAAGRQRAGIGVSAARRCPFLQTAQAVAGCAHLRPRAVVCDLEIRFARLSRQANGARGSPAVPDHVGDPFANGPRERRVDGGRQQSPLTSTVLSIPAAVSAARAPASAEVKLGCR